MSQSVVLVAKLVYYFTEGKLFVEHAVHTLLSVADCMLHSIAAVVDLCKVMSVDRY